MADTSDGTDALTTQIKATPPEIQKVVSESKGVSPAEGKAQPSNNSSNATEKITEDAMEKMDDGAMEKIIEDAMEKNPEGATEKMDEGITETVAEDATEKMDEGITETVAEDATEKMDYSEPRQDASSTKEKDATKDDQENLIPSQQKPQESKELEGSSHAMYSCSLCEMFGLVRSVLEEHCKRKHNLTGDDVHKAIKCIKNLSQTIKVEGDDEDAGVGKKVQKLGRSMRLRAKKAARDAEDNIIEKSTSAKKRVLTSSLHLTPSKKAKHDSGGRSKNSQSAKEATKPVASGRTKTEDNRCSVCNRYFGRPRQMEKHKCISITVQIKLEEDDEDELSERQKRELKQKEAAKKENQRRKSEPLKNSTPVKVSTQKNMKQSKSALKPQTKANKTVEKKKKTLGIKLNIATKVSEKKLEEKKNEIEGNMEKVGEDGGDLKEAVIEETKEQPDLETKPKIKQEIKPKTKRKDPLYDCSFCEQSFRTEEAAMTHMKRHVMGYKVFQCEDCDFEASRQNGLTYHMKKHHQAAYSCDVCSYTTMNEDKLKRHKEFWSRGIKGSCELCHTKFPRKTKAEHLKQVHNIDCASAEYQKTTYRHKCSICDEKFQDRKTCRMHEKKHLPKFTCALCSHVTSSHLAFVNHGKKHRIILGCSECPKKFYSTEILKKHLESHCSPLEMVGEFALAQQIQTLYEKSVNNFSVYSADALDEKAIPECDIVGLDMITRVREEERRGAERMDTSDAASIAERKALLWGKILTMDEFQKIGFGEDFQFFAANITYKRLEMRILHFLFARYGKKECPYCGFLLHTATSWKLHIDSHEGKSRFACDECSFTCRHKYVLTRHVMVEHKGHKFQCDMCDKAFSHKEYLYTHKRNDHLNGKFTCTECENFECDNDQAMKTHIIENHPEMSVVKVKGIMGRKVHFTGKDGVLFVKCKFCDKGFNRIALLRRHVAIIHEKAKPFQCTHCGYRANTSARLKIHMAVHTEERNTICDQCGEAFKSKVYLYKHIRRLHKRYATSKGAQHCKRVSLGRRINQLKTGVAVADLETELIEDPNASMEEQVEIFQCGDCGELCKTLDILQEHFNQTHSAETSNQIQNNDGGIALGSIDHFFQCGKCNRLYPDMKSVELHLQNDHAGETHIVAEVDTSKELMNLAKAIAETSSAQQLEEGKQPEYTTLQDMHIIEEIQAVTDLVESQHTQLVDSNSNGNSQQPTETFQVVALNETVSTQEEQSQQMQNQQAGGSVSKTDGVVRDFSSLSREDDLEAAQLLQQMGILQNIAGNSQTVNQDGTIVSNGTMPGGGEENYTIMVISDEVSK